MKKSMEIAWYALEVIHTLERAGYEAYVVGGCVRDMLLSRQPQDWDITTNASPEQVKEQFSRTIDTGIAHGTVTVMFGKIGCEVTTYRVDGVYKDGRHPESVKFTASLEEDLKRRDFTINAMAYNPKSGLIDLFDGRKDLENGVIRCVGDAHERFTEDALRMMRAVRFSAQLGFSIEEKTAEVARELSHRLGMVSRERVQAELVKLLVSDNPDRLLIAAELGLAGDFLECFSRQTVKEQQRRVLAAAALPPDKALRLAAVICPREYTNAGAEGDTADSLSDKADAVRPRPDESLKRLAQITLRALKFDNETTDRVKNLCAWCNTRLYFPEADINVSKTRIRCIMSALGRAEFEQLIKLQGAVYPERTKEIAKALSYYREITAAGDCVSLKELALTGRDLIAAGVKPGKAMGDMLEKMLELVLEHPEGNNKEYLSARFIMKKNEEGYD